MSLLFRRPPQPAALEKRSNTFSYQQLGLAMAAAISSSPRTSSIDEALRDTATWACIKVKAQGAAQCPIDVVRYEGKRRREMSAPVVVTAPSGIVSQRVWVFQAFSSMFSDGNIFGLVVDEDPMGRPTQIELVAPESCKQRKVVDGVVQVTIERVVHRRHPHGDLWHVPGEMVLAGSPFGLSPIGYGSGTTGTSLAAEDFGGQFFADGGHPSGVLSVGVDPGEEGAKAIKEKFLSITRGNRELVVLPKDTSYTTLQVDPKDSQFLELLRFEVEQTARRHGVPPAMVAAAITGGSTITYSNVTQADLMFLKHTLSYPIDLFEDAWSALLPQPRFVVFNRDAILEGDPNARVDIQTKRLNNRTTTVNEIRALDDKDGFGPEFDVPGIPPFTQPANGGA